jgi:hypothetical protein
VWSEALNEYLLSLEHWDRGFESPSWHVCTGWPRSGFTENVHCLSVFISTCVQIFFDAGGNTVATLAHISVSICCTDVLSQFVFGST